MRNEPKVARTPFKNFESLEGNTYDILTIKNDDLSNDVSVKRTVRSTFVTILLTALLTLVLYKCIFLRQPRP